jgi:hypothetical protein
MGLYTSLIKSNNLIEAEEVYIDIIEIAVASKRLYTKFIFKVDSVEYAPYSIIGKELELYPSRLRQIAKHIDKYGTCFKIIGHASATGTDKYDMKLSNRRAIRIKYNLEQSISSDNNFDNNLIPLGRGHSECIMCDKEDSDKNGIDRRVEFKVIDCQK